MQAVSKDEVTERSYPQLDGLRAIAVSCVLYHHWIGNRYRSDNYSEWYFYFLKAPLGELGVAIFFVLSGFLITQILSKYQHDNRQSKRRLIRNFWIRRALRIFPIYFITVGIATYLSVWPFREYFWWLFGYVANIPIFLEQRWIGPASHLWTLSIEEQFYIFWPVLAIFFARHFLTAATIIVVGSFLVQCLTAVLFPTVRFVNLLPIVGMDALAIGGLIALQGRSAKLFVMIAQRLVWLLPVVLVARSINLPMPGLDLLAHSIFLATAVVLVVGAAQNLDGPAGRLLSWGPIRFAGIISYGIYLYHNFVPLMLGRMFREFGVSFYSLGFGLRLVLMVCMTLFIATMSWIIVERPINGLKRYFGYGERLITRSTGGIV